MISLLLALLACPSSPSPPSPAESPAAPAATEVRVGKATRADRDDVLVAEGRTDVLARVDVRAPFAGTLADLRVQVGDAVIRGQVLGRLASVDGRAAEAGARTLERAASTDAERADATRAAELAHRAAVTVPVVAPRAGVVASVVAAEGSDVGPGDVLLTLVEPEAVGFAAQVDPRHLSALAVGQAATVRLGEAPRPAHVRRILPQGGATVGVWLELDTPMSPPVMGLYGQASVVVGTHAGVLAVPGDAVLVNDLDGTRRVARVTSEGTATWVDVETGIEQDGRIEITRGDIDIGATVVVAGQVGLPEGAPVRSTP